MWKRVFEFLLACIAVRLSIMFSFIYYAHYYGNSQVLPWTGIVAFLLGTIQYTRFFAVLFRFGGIMRELCTEQCIVCMVYLLYIQNHIRGIYC